MVVFTIYGLTTKDIAKAQQRENFLVDKISRYVNASIYSLTEYVYDTDNKLVKRIFTNTLDNNYSMFIDELEYENGLVSKIYTQMSDYPQNSSYIHFHYNLKGELIRRESWWNGAMIDYSDYHYENGRIVSIHNDKTKWFEKDTIFYDNTGNIYKRIETWQKTSNIEQPIPGEYIERELYYEYDDNPKPNFGLDYLFAYQFFTGFGDSFPCAIMNLSNNNMIRAHFEQETYYYTYNEHGLPKTLQIGYDFLSSSPIELTTITYKQIGGPDMSETLQTASGINIYPNPTADKFFIEGENYNTVALYDMLGREVLNQHINQKTEINISHLPKGIYNVIVFSEGNVIGNSKIVKQ